MKEDVCAIRGPGWIGLERRRISSQACPLSPGSKGEEATEVVAVTNMVVGTAAALAQAVNASSPASSMPTLLDTLRKHLKTVMEAI